MQLFSTNVMDTVKICQDFLVLNCHTAFIYLFIIKNRTHSTRQTEWTEQYKKVA